jgi:hypothetical protein
LTGATVAGSYLVLAGRYQLNILGLMLGTLSPQLEQRILRWIWERPEGIGYLGVPLNGPPPDRPGPFDRWLSSLELLARVFQSWTSVARSSMEWLWQQRARDGLWDFGSRSNTGSYLPLSDTWRRTQNRRFDWTTRLLVLMRQFCDRGVSPTGG